MSLKAKLEAVIYAAEEPVTLAQLAMLFGNEALELKAEQDAARAAEAALNAEAAGEPPVNEAFDYVDTNEGAAAEQNEGLIDVEAEMAGSSPSASADGDAAAGAENAVPAEPEAAVSAEPEAGVSAGPGEAVQSGEAAGAGAEAGEATLDPAAAEAEVRRVARQRDRDVRAILRQLLDEVIASYETDGRGIEIREIAGGFRMATKPEFHDAVRAFVKSQKPPLKLSLPALETLAVIAYKQPVTAPEVNEIRGVDSSGVFGSLLARKLIATAGRKQVIGRPILYKTTKEFLLRFGLKDLAELPSMEEFEKMAASELEDMGPAESAPAAPSELDENADEAAGENGGESQEPAAVAAAPAAADEIAEPPSAPEPVSPQPEGESNPTEPAPPSAESSEVAP